MSRIVFLRENPTGWDGMTGDDEQAWDVADFAGKETKSDGSLKTRRYDFFLFRVFSPASSHRLVSNPAWHPPSTRFRILKTHSIIRLSDRNPLGYRNEKRYSSKPTRRRRRSAPFSSHNHTSLVIRRPSITSARYPRPSFPNSSKARNELDGL